MREKSKCIPRPRLVTMTNPRRLRIPQVSRFSIFKGREISIKSTCIILAVSMCIDIGFEENPVPMEGGGQIGVGQNPREKHVLPNVDLPNL